MKFTMMCNVTAEERSSTGPPEHQCVSTDDRSLFCPVLHELPQGRDSDLRLMYKHCEETQKEEHGTEGDERNEEGDGI